MIHASRSQVAIRFTGLVSVPAQRHEALPFRHLDDRLRCEYPAHALTDNVTSQHDTGDGGSEKTRPKTDFLDCRRDWMGDDWP